MKIKQLTMAVAAASVMASGSALAGNHGTTVSSMLSEATISGEAYGAYRNGSENDGLGNPNSESDNADFDLDELRLGINGNVGEDTSWGVELGLNPGDTAGSSSSNVVVRDLFMAKSYGNTTVTAGRFKQIADRDNYIEKSDALFNDSVSIGSIGSARRVDGIEVKSHMEGGVHGSLSLYKGGIDATGGDIDRSFGIAGSVGWQGGNNDMSFGVTLTAFQEDGTEIDGGSPTGLAAGNDTDGFGVSTFIATGPIVATLGYADNESESTVTGSTKTESDGIQLQAAMDLGGAARAFDQFGVLQGPSGLGDGDRGFEAVISYGTGESKTGASKTDNDGWGIGLNMYCGQYTKWFIQYNDAEEETGAITEEIDGFSIGGRLDF